MSIVERHSFELRSLADTFYRYRMSVRSILLAKSPPHSLSANEDGLSKKQNLFNNK